MSAETFTQIKVTSLRHEHVGRRVHIVDSEELLDIFQMEEVTGTIESLSAWPDGVAIGVDFWDEVEASTVSIEVEFATSDTVGIGGAS